METETWRLVGLGLMAGLVAPFLRWALGINDLRERINKLEAQADRTPPDEKQTANVNAETP